MGGVLVGTGLPSVMAPYFDDASFWQLSIKLKNKLIGTRVPRNHTGRCRVLKRRSSFSYDKLRRFKACTEFAMPVNPQAARTNGGSNDFDNCSNLWKATVRPREAPIFRGEMKGLHLNAVRIKRF